MAEKRRGLCRLCGETKKLVKAHIVPRSFCEAMPGGEQLYLIGTPGIPGHRHPKKRSPTGRYDTGILCGECDEVIGRNYDEHAANTMLQTEPTPVKKDGITVALAFPNADSERLKRFFVSVLWRASISDELFCQGVDNLGPYQRYARDALLGESSKFDHFEVVGYVDIDTYSPILHPGKLERDATGINFWCVYIGKYWCKIKTDQRALPPEDQIFRLGGEGRADFAAVSYRGSARAAIAIKAALNATGQ